MRKLLIACLAGISLYVSGCGLISVQPQTPRQSVVVVYGTLEAAYKTAVARLDAGLITNEKFVEWVSALNRADAYVDLAAEAAKAGDGQAADQYLALAQQILNEIERAQQ